MFYSRVAINQMEKLYLTLCLLISFATAPLFSHPLFTIDSKLASDPHQQEMDNIASSLNAYVEFINESVNATRWLQQSLVSYNLHANYFQGIDFTQYSFNGSLSFSAERFIIPRDSYYEAEQRSKYIPLSSRNQIEIYKDEIMSILLEMDSLQKALALYLKNQEFLQDNLSNSDAILNRMTDLYNMFDFQKEQLFRELNLAFHQYIKPATNPAWKDTFEHNKSLLQSNFELYLKLKQQYTGEIDTGGPFQIGDQAKALYNYKNQWVKDASGLANLKVRNYELIRQLMGGMERKAESYVLRVQRLEQSLFRDQLSFDRLTYSYNEIINYYNRLCELVPVPKLKQVKQPYLFIKIESKKMTEMAESAQNTKQDTLFLTGNPMADYAVNNLVLLLDVSASMRASKKLPLLKQSLANLIPILRPEDEISIIVFSGKAKTALMPTSLSNRELILETIDGLQPEGKSNFNEGLKLAFKVARQNYRSYSNNRIIVATDGEFNIENATYPYIKRQISNYDIHLSVFFYGNPEKAGNKIKKVAKTGDGIFTEIHPKNSDKMLLSELQAKKKN